MIPIKPGQIYKHENGNFFTVLYISNICLETQDKFPITIVYQGTDGRIWTKAYKNWSNKFTLIS